MNNNSNHCHCGSNCKKCGARCNGKKPCPCEQAPAKNSMKNSSSLQCKCDSNCDGKKNCRCA